MRKKFTFVDVFAVPSIARVTWLAFTSKRSIFIDALRVAMATAVVMDAFVHVIAAHAVAFIARFALAFIGSYRVSAICIVATWALNFGAFTGVTYSVALATFIRI